MGAYIHTYMYSGLLHVLHLQPGDQFRRVLSSKSKDIMNASDLETLYDLIGNPTYLHTHHFLSIYHCILTIIGEDFYVTVPTPSMLNHSEDNTSNGKVTILEGTRITLVKTRYIYIDTYIHTYISTSQTPNTHVL